MSRLTRVFALTLASVSLALPARAEAGPKTAPAPSWDWWDLGARIGYATSWTTAQSFLGPGTGLAGGVTLLVPIRLEVGAIYHTGSTVSAANESIQYWSRQWCILGHAGLGYELSMFAKRFIVRPRIIAAGIFLSDTTQVAGATQKGIEPIFAFGPAADVMVRFGGLYAGIDARAFFVPSRVAAPIGGLYGALGAEF